MFSKRVVMAVCFVFVFLSISPSPVQGQTAGSGSVGGTVTDPSKAVIVGATVTLTDTATGAARTSVTNESGRFF